MFFCPIGMKGLPEGECDKEGAGTTLNKAVTYSRRQQIFNTAQVRA